MSGTSDKTTLAPSLADFRNEMPEFADSSKYDDGIVQMYLDLAVALLPLARWGNWYRLGIKMFVAHNLVLDQQATQAGQRGGLPGMTAGIMSSKSIGSVSVSYDTQAGIEVDAGHWNMTTFGRRFINAVRMVGAGGVQVYL